MQIPNVEIIDSVSKGHVSLEDTQLIWVGDKLYKITALTPVKPGIYRPVLSGHKYSVSLQDTKINLLVSHQDTNNDVSVSPEDTNIMSFQDTDNGSFVSSEDKVFVSSQDRRNIDEVSHKDTADNAKVSHQDIAFGPLAKKQEISIYDF